MIKKMFCFAALVALAIPAQASVLTFSAAQLDAFTVQDATPAFTIAGGGGPTEALTANPTYSDGTTGMSGSAGAAGLWLGAPASSTPEVFFGSSFAATDLSGYTDLEIVAYNDNEDIWGFDVWIETVGDGVVSSAITEINGSTAGAPFSAVVGMSLAGLDLANVVGYGVSVHGNLIGGDYPSATDGFHASWTAVPEPTSAGLWAVMAFTGLAARRRRRS